MKSVMKSQPRRFWRTSLTTIGLSQSGKSVGMASIGAVGGGSGDDGWESVDGICGNVGCREKMTNYE
jgi:hypothetical protein